MFQNVLLLDTDVFYWMILDALRLILMCVYPDVFIHYVRLQLEFV